MLLVARVLLLALLLLEAGCSYLGGFLRFTVAADPASLNPLFARNDASGVDQELAHLTFEPFIDVDAKGQLVPALLSEIPTVANGGISRDGKTITYHLRKGVDWSDGVEVTSHDVVFTLGLIFNRKNPIRSREGYDLVDDASTTDKYTVVVHLRRRWAPAVTSLFSYGTNPQYVLPEHVLKDVDLTEARFNSNPVGDGPYKLKSWKRGESLVYESNPHYWRGKPKSGLLNIRIVPDPNTNLTLLRSKDLDWNLIAPSQRAALRGRTDLRYKEVPIALVAGIALNIDHVPLNDVTVRRAIAASIDRVRISKTLTLGQYPVIDTAQPLFSWARDPSVKEPGYDPAAADALLNAAGWYRGPGGFRYKGGKRLELTYVQFPESTTATRVATFVQSELGQRGIAVTIKSISNAQLFAPAENGGILRKGDFDLAYVPWTTGYDPDDSFMLSCSGNENYMDYCNQKIDDLENAALSASSQAERKRIYSQIEHQVAEDVPIIFLFNPKYIYAYSNEVQNFDPNPFTPTWNAYQWSVNGP